MRFLLALALLLSVAIAAEAPAPRIVALTGEAYPAALILAVDPAAGVVTYAYLKPDGTRADSGNSIAKFTPPAPLAKDNPGDPDVYPAISDATLIAAIKAAS